MNKNNMDQKLQRQHIHQDSNGGGDIDETHNVVLDLLIGGGGGGGITDTGGAGTTTAAAATTATTATGGTKGNGNNTNRTALEKPTTTDEDNRLFLEEVKRAIGIRPPPRTITINNKDDNDVFKDASDSSIDIDVVDNEGGTTSNNKEGGAVVNDDAVVVTPSRDDLAIVEAAATAEEDEKNQNQELIQIEDGWEGSISITAAIGRADGDDENRMLAANDTSMLSSSTSSSIYKSAIHEDQEVEEETTPDNKAEEGHSNVDIDDNNVSASFARFIAMDKAEKMGGGGGGGGGEASSSAAEGGIGDNTSNNQCPSSIAHEDEEEHDDGIEYYDDYKEENPVDVEELYSTLRTLYKHLRQKDDDLEKERHIKQSREKAVLKMAKELVQTKELIKRQSHRIEQLMIALEEEQAEKDEIENRLQNQLFSFNEEQEDFCRSLEEELELYKSLSKDTITIHKSTSSSYNSSDENNSEPQQEEQQPQQEQRLQRYLTNNNAAVTTQSNNGEDEIDGIISLTTSNASNFILTPDYLYSLDDKDAIWAICSKYGGDALQHVKGKYKDDEKIVLGACKQNGLAIQFATPRIRGNRKIVFVACQQSSGLALFYATSELKSDKDFVLAICQDINGWALSACSPALQADIDVVMAAIKQNGLALQFANKRLRRNKQVVLTACLQNVEALQYAATASSLSSSSNHTGAANSSFGGGAFTGSGIGGMRTSGGGGGGFGGTIFSFLFRKRLLRDDKKFVISICRRNGKALAYASPKLQADKDVVMVAIRSNPNSFQYAQGHVRNDPECLQLFADMKSEQEKDHHHHHHHDVKAPTTLSSPKTITIKTHKDKEHVQLAGESTNNNESGVEMVLQVPPSPPRQQRKIVVSTTEYSVKATEFVMLFREHEYIQGGSFTIHETTASIFSEDDDNMKKTSCCDDGDYDDVVVTSGDEKLVSCRGTTETCRKEDISLKSGVPKDGSCWKYTFRYLLEQAKKTNGFMIQVIEQQEEGDSSSNGTQQQQLEDELAKDVGIKVFHVHTVVDRLVEHKDIDLFVSRIQKWYEGKSTNSNDEDNTTDDDVFNSVVVIPSQQDSGFRSSTDLWSNAADAQSLYETQTTSISDDS